MTVKLVMVLLEKSTPVTIFSYIFLDLAIIFTIYLDVIFSDDTSLFTGLITTSQEHSPISEPAVVRQVKVQI